MGALDINQAISSNLTGTLTAYDIASMNVDSATGQDETVYNNPDFSKYWGWFNSVSELKAAILMKAIWNVGKGYNTDPETKVILEHISGWGKDTFQDILFNMEVIKRINGDAFAEIIRADDKTKTILNLKPLDPSTIKIIVDKKGVIKRYEQTRKTGGDNLKFQPEEILHFSNNRFADQIHGISDIKAMEKVILADEQNFDDMIKIMHRQAKPMIMFKLGTDDPTKIAAFVAKMDTATQKGENIYIPDDANSVSFEVVQVNVSQIIMEWRNDLRNKFYRSLGLPEIVFGTSGSTESGGKMEYLAHEQIFEKDQKEIENQIWNQLALKIDLISPVSLLENLKTDENKDVNGMGIQPNDMMAGSGK